MRYAIQPQFLGWCWLWLGL